MAVLEKHRESELKILELQRREGDLLPVYEEAGGGSRVGVEVSAETVMGYGDSLSLSPVQKTTLRIPSKTTVRPVIRTLSRLQASPVRPQFESEPLVGERFNRFYSRNRARNSTSSPSFSFNILVQH